MVSEVPTSDPPVRSVIHCPEVQKTTASRETRRGKTRWRRSASPCTSIRRAAPSVIASGQVKIADDGVKRYSFANWTTRLDAPNRRS
jgi:hypothetical protein